MDRTSAPPPKTNITTLAAVLATATFAIWMSNFAAHSHSLYAERAVQTVGIAHTEAAPAPRVSSNHG